MGLEGGLRTGWACEMVGEAKVPKRCKCFSCVADLTHSSNTNTTTRPLTREPEAIIAFASLHAALH